jgi:hypothetical protein
MLRILHPTTLEKRRRKHVTRYFIWLGSVFYLRAGQKIHCHLSKLDDKEMPYPKRERGRERERESEKNGKSARYLAKYIHITLYRPCLFYTVPTPLMKGTHTTLQLPTYSSLENYTQFCHSRHVCMYMPAVCM